MRKNYYWKNRNKVKNEEDKEKLLEAMFVSAEDMKEFDTIPPASIADEEEYLL